jgi:hypothetical protein
MAAASSRPPRKPLPIRDSVRSRADNARWPFLEVPAICQWYAVRKENYSRAIADLTEATKPPNCSRNPSSELS